jgi:hypothetical protein
VRSAECTIRLPIFAPLLLAASPTGSGGVRPKGTRVLKSAGGCGRARRTKPSGRVPAQATPPARLHVCLFACGRVTCPSHGSDQLPRRADALSAEPKRTAACARCTLCDRCTLCARCTLCDRCRLHAAALSLLQHERLELGVQVRFAPPRLRHLAPWVSRRSAAASRDPARAKKPGAGRFARTAASAACELSSCLSSSASCRAPHAAWAHGRRRGGAMADLRRLSAGVGCADELKLRHAAPIRS